MATIKAPFNFVPLSDKVFFPDWADKISQDIPFEDGVSGTIDLKITAQTPIFVRNGHTKEDGDNKTDRYRSFSKTDDGRYFIPATSIKGCIRNVLEIMSFGKMGKNRVQNQSFGMRDLSNCADGVFYRAKIKTENIHCGWLQLKNDIYTLCDCGLPWRISVETIDDKLGTQFTEFVKNSQNFKNEDDCNIRKDYNRTAQNKYQLFGEKELIHKFSADDDTRNALKVGGRLFVKFDSDGQDGCIVFTGQPGERKIGKKKTKSGKESWTGKFFEFVFPCTTEKENIVVSKDVINDFISVHRTSPDFKDFRKQQLLNGDRIPVFFLYKKDGTVEAIGLSYMFKYPSFNQIYNAIRNEDLSEKLDLADCIFGCVFDDNALKGRIHFGHALAQNNPQPLQEIPLVMSSPNPSYYPLYLGNGQTWNSDGIRIAGWKRYPTRNKLSESSKGSNGMDNSICPLPAETIFKGKIQFFNLKKEEVGALFAALLLNGEKDCYHSLGSGKPLGFGKVKVEIENYDMNSISIYMNEFWKIMEQECKGWMNSQTITELIAMTRGIPNGKESDFTYMHMDTKRDKNEFLLGRDLYAKGEQLGYFSQIINNNVHRAKFVGNVEAAKERVLVEQLEQKKKERRQKYIGLINSAKQNISEGELDGAEQLLKNAKEYTSDYSEIDDLCQLINSERKKKNDAKLEESRLAEEEQRRQANAIPLAEKIANAQKIPTLCGNVKTWMKMNGVESLNEDHLKSIFGKIKDIVSQMKPKDRDRLRNFGKELDSLVGSDMASNWFNEIVHP